MDWCHKWNGPGVCTRFPVINNMYVNDTTDTTDCIQNTLEMFADDLKLYRMIRNPCDTDSTAGFKLHFNWSKHWLLKFNTTSCSVIHLGRNDKVTHCLTKPQTSISEQNHLGVWITPSMTFSVHCHRSASKAIKPWVWSNVILNTSPKVPLWYYTKHLFDHIWSNVPQSEIPAI